MATSTTDIQKLYIAYFNRPADTAGLAFWQARADAAGSVEAIASQFSNSTEYTALFDGASSFEIVNQLYINLFGRSPEEAGLKYWAAKLDSGELTIGTVAYTIANSAQNDDLVAITNKVTAADQFTNTLTVDEIIGYSGTSPNQVAKDWLAGITDNASLEAALQSLDATQAAAAAARGAVFELTVATDTFGPNAAAVPAGTPTNTSTIYNDTFNATDATLLAGDSIDGGQGVDTLNLVVGTAYAEVGTVKNIEKINITGLGAGPAVVSAAFYAGSTDIAADGVATEVKDVSKQTVTFTGTGINNTVTTTATATSAAVKLVKADGTVTITGAKVAAASVVGTVTGDVVLVDGNTTDSIKTLTLSLAADVSLAGAQVAVDTSALGALANLDASSSRASLSLTSGPTVTSVKTGSGTDQVLVNTVFDTKAAAAAGVSLATGSVVTISTGDGADLIGINITGTTAPTTGVKGTVNVDGGAGDDTFSFVSAVLAGTTLTLNGGEGTDKVIVDGGFSLDQTGFAALSAAVTSVEVAQFTAGASVDAAYLTKFETLEFVGNSTVTNASEALVAHANLTASAVGYVAAIGAGTATYGANVDVTAVATGGTINVNASNATVTVHSETAATIATTVGGDVGTLLTVNVQNYVDTDAEVFHASGATVLVDASNNTTLKSVVLAGDGSVTLDNSAGVALVSVDASKLGGLNLDGEVTGGLTYTGKASLVETITLGSGHDVITVASTYAKMDTITGFDAVKETATADLTSTSDVLIFGGKTISGAVVGEVSKFTLAGSDTTLDLALAHAATVSNAGAVAGDSAIVSFVFEGNTYLFKDVVVAGSAAGSLDATDLVVKLTGVVDLSTAFGTHA
jgi:hypothetical protein